MLERAMVFVDGNNVYQGLRACYGLERLDLEPFCKHIAQNRDLVSIYYADSNFIQSLGRNNYDRQQAYFSHIRKIPNLVFRKGYYNTHTKPVNEKRSDVYLATDMVDLCHRDQFDVAYLVSGDSDLSPAVDIVFREGKKVINVYFDKPAKLQGGSGRTAYALRTSCNGQFIEITYSVASKYQWLYVGSATPTPPKQHP